MECDNVDTKELKNYIYENRYVEQLLESIGCHHIKYHSSGEYWTCANATGDNNGAIVIYDNESLFCTNYTRQMVKGNRATDIIDLVCYTKGVNFINGIKTITSEIGISYYHDFNEDVPESFKILKMIEDMGGIGDNETEKPLKPINEKIISYYKPYVNDIFYEDNIDYETQREFEIGFDEESNRYTIPIRSEIGDLVGVKGRYFYREVPDDKNKYIYLEPCSKSKILYGLYKTADFARMAQRIYIFESEKAVMQLWSYGFKNSVATGGKEISKVQIDMIVRLGTEIVLCFDKDVKKDEYEEIAERFPEGISLLYIYDEDNILSDHESPSDDPNKWNYLVSNNVYQLR